MRASESVLIALILLLSPSPTGWDLKPVVVVWDVGQGQMVTWVHPQACLHFDMGGEDFPWQVGRLCRQKRNLLYLTHADHDHINFVSRFQKKVADLCLAQAPLLLNRSWQWRYLSSLQPCSPQEKTFLQPQRLKPTPSRQERRLGSLNTWSWVFVLPPSVLIAGDSPKKMERSWAPRLPNPTKIRTLVAGHHGSNTSTSHELLRELPSLETVIISARKRRYGHPHPEVMERLRRSGAQIFLTEIDGPQVIWP